MERYALDTSALIALRHNEPGADQVQEILKRAEAGRSTVFVSFISFMEVFYGVWRMEGKGSALRSYLELKMLPIERVDVTEKIIFTASEIKATARLSLANSWVAATAIEHKATLVHKDPEFEPLKDRVALCPLPYKQKR